MGIMNSLMVCCFHRPSAASTTEKPMDLYFCLPANTGSPVPAVYSFSSWVARICSQKGCQRSEKLSGSIICANIRPVSKENTVFPINTLASEELNRSAGALQTPPDGQC